MWSPELELRVRDSWITNHFFDPTHQKCVKLLFFMNCFFPKQYVFSLPRVKWARFDYENQTKFCQPRGYTLKLKIIKIPVTNQYFFLNSNPEASINNSRKMFYKLGLFLTTSQSQMLYLSIKQVTSNFCKIIAQFRYFQYVVKILKELFSTQSLNFLKKIVFFVPTNLDFVHLTHVKAS